MACRSFVFLCDGKEFLQVVVNCLPQYLRLMGLKVLLRRACAHHGLVLLWALCIEMFARIDTGISRQGMDL